MLAHVLIIKSWISFITRHKKDWVTFYYLQDDTVKRILQKS